MMRIAGLKRLLKRRYVRLALVVAYWFEKSDGFTGLWAATGDAKGEKGPIYALGDGQNSMKGGSGALATLAKTPQPMDCWPGKAVGVRARALASTVRGLQLTCLGPYDS